MREPAYERVRTIQPQRAATTHQLVQRSMLPKNYPLSCIPVTLGVRPLTMKPARIQFLPLTATTGEFGPNRREPTYVAKFATRRIYLEISTLSLIERFRCVPLHGEGDEQLRRTSVCDRRRTPHGGEQDLAWPRAI